MRLTLEVAPGGEAVRVVLMSKRFERLQAARARAMERASRPTRAAASASRRGLARRPHPPRRKMMERTRALTRQLLPAPRPPPRTRRARAVVGGSGRVGDGPPGRRAGGCHEEGGETANDGRCASRKKTKKTSQRSFSRPAPADDGTKRDDDDDDAFAGSARRGRSIFFPPQTREFAKERKRAARVLASRRGHRRAPRASQGEVRGGGVRLGAQPSRARNGDVTKNILRRSASGASPQPGARAVRRVRPEKLRRHRLDLWSLVAARRVVAEQGRASDRGRFGERRETRRRGEDVYVNLRFRKCSIGVCAVRSVRRRVVLRPGVRRVGLAAPPQTVRGCAVFVRAARRRRNTFGVRSRRARRVGGVSKRVSRDERRAGNEVGVKR